MIPTLDDIAREKAQRHLRDFIRQAWHVVEPATPYVHGWHIDAIAEHLEAVSRGEIRNLLINMPPRHMKSLAVSVFWPAWEWTRNPSIRWLFASYASGLSIRDSLKCRRIIESEWYRGRWGTVYRLTSDQNVKARFENDRTGYRLATSVDGAATGEGGDRVVVDDPHNVREAMSPTIRRATLAWWDEVMSTRLNDPKTSAKIIVMQRVHEDDLSGHVLAQGGYEHLMLPAEYDGRKSVTVLGWRDPRETPGELLWPERFGANELAALKRALGSYGTAGQLQQRPSPEEGGLFKRQWWRFYQTIPSDMDEVMQSWDMTFKRTADNDFVVGQVWGRRGADRYLLAQIRGRMNFPETVAAVRRLTQEWPEAWSKLVEATANGPAVIDTLSREITGLIAVSPEGGKAARAAAISPQVEAGNVYLPDPALFPWVHDFIEECAAFPNGAHDDQVDAMTQALLRFTRGGGWLQWLTGEADALAEGDRHDGMARPVQSGN